MPDMNPFRIVIATLFLFVPSGAFLAQVSLQRPKEGVQVTAVVEGRVTKLEWTTPRVNIYIATPEPDTGKSTNWVIRAGAPGESNATNIRRTDMRVGATVRAKGVIAGDHVLDAAWADVSFPKD